MGAISVACRTSGGGGGSSRGFGATIVALGRPVAPVAATTVASDESGCASGSGLRTS